MRRLLIALVSLLLCLPLVVLSASTGPAGASPGAERSAPARALPAKARWEADVDRVMAGSPRWLKQRVAEGRPPGKRLALNLDVDNTMLATTYARGEAVIPVRRLVKRARARGVAILVNTARDPRYREQTRAELARAGFVVDELCFGRSSLGLAQGKQRCRQRYRDAGYRLVANIGNRPTDFEGRGYEKAYKLPDYRGRLG